jgi:hypothetical protein
MEECSPEQTPGSRGEAFATGAGDDGIRVAHLEAALLEIVGKIEFAPADEKSAFRVDDDIDSVAGNKDVAVTGTVNQVHLVLQARAPAPDNSNAEAAVRPALALKEATQVGRGTIQDLHQLFIADLVVHRRVHGGKVHPLPRRVNQGEKASQVAESSEGAPRDL